MIRGDKMKMIILAALLPIGLVLAASGLITLVRGLIAHLRKTPEGDEND